MSFRIVGPDYSDSEEKSGEESKFCIIYAKNSSYSFFVRKSDEERISEAVDSDSEESLKIDYIQKIYDPVEEDDFMAKGRAIIKISSITGVCFEWHESLPLFED